MQAPEKIAVARATGRVGLHVVDLLETFEAWLEAARVA